MPQFKIPRKLRIYDLDYEVVETDQEPVQEGKEPNPLWLGRACEDTCRIYLNKRMCSQKKLQVLMHEFAHVILFENALDFESDAFEETVVQVMANGFMQMMNQMEKIRNV